MADFFEDGEVEEVAISHIEAIRSLEDREAQKILKAYRRVRQDLRDRLDILDSDSFSAQRLRSTLLQVELAIKEMTEGLKRDFGGSADLAAVAGVEDLVTEIRRWDKAFTGEAVAINLDAVAIASNTRNFLFNRYEVSMQAYSETLRARIAQGLTDAVVAQDSFSEAVARIGKTFLSEEWKLQQIVRTELHNVYNLGKINGMTELWGEGEGPIGDLKKTLFHPMDHRTGEDSKRLAQKNPIVPIDEPFVEYSTGKRLEYMAPPNRPNDRAILIPYRDAWKSR
jgi:hypothetical protein